MHQGDGFYSPNWVSRVRNPNKWGQCNVIDAPSFDLPNGERLELQAFAKRIAYKSNRRISDRRFHFQVNNTNTSQSKSRHKEQRRSLTYYALSKQHKIALGLEATRNCPLPRAVSYLAIAVNSVMDEIGIVTTNLPS